MTDDCRGLEANGAPESGRSRRASAAPWVAALLAGVAFIGVTTLIEWLLGHPLAGGIGGTGLLGAVLTAMCVGTLTRRYQR
jgi:hypothetical protein